MPGFFLVAKGGIEPPTQGFSGHPDKRDLILNQALATNATFREQRHEGRNESNEGKKRYAVATLPIRQRVATRSGDDDRSGEHRNANALRLEHHETACEPIRVLAYQIEHPGPDG